MSNYGQRFLEAHRKYVRELNVNEGNDLQRLAKRKFRWGLRNTELKHDVTNGEVDSTSLNDFVKTIIAIDTARRNEEYNRVSNDVQRNNSTETLDQTLIKKLIEMFSLNDNHSAENSRKPRNFRSSNFNNRNYQPFIDNQPCQNPTDFGFNHPNNYNNTR